MNYPLPAFYGVERGELPARLGLFSRIALRVRRWLATLNRRTR